MRESLKTRRIPITTSASAYSAGDQVGALLTIEKVPNAREAKLITLAVLDKASQKATITVHFFSKAPTIASSDNAALDITDAEMTSKYLGSVSIPNTAYIDLAASAVATINNIQMVLLAQDQEIPGKYKGNKIYAVVETAGTPTYGAGANLQLIMGFEG